MTSYAQTHPRTIRELSPMELDCVRFHLACTKYTGVPAFLEAITDEELYKEYEGVSFVWEDLHSSYDEDENFNPIN